jgi:hypothetical protein
MDQWIGNNVDLNQLSQAILQFFNSDEFVTKLEQTKKGCKIEALTKIPTFPLKIYVDVYGRPNDFTVEFTTSKTKKGTLSPSMIIGYLTSPFGGGTILLNGLKTQEAVDKIEKMFWEHVDKQVSQLTGLAESNS